MSTVYCRQIHKKIFPHGSMRAGVSQVPAAPGVRVPGPSAGIVDIPIACGTRRTQGGRGRVRRAPVAGRRKKKSPWFCSPAAGLLSADAVRPQPRIARGFFPGDPSPAGDGDCAGRARPGAPHRGPDPSGIMVAHGAPPRPPGQDSGWLKERRRPARRAREYPRSEAGGFPLTSENPLYTVCSAWGADAPGQIPIPSEFHADGGHGRPFSIQGK